MHAAAALVGGLIGVLPGMLLVAIGQVVTDGGDGMVPFGVGGLVLMVVGAVAGGTLGASMHSRFAAHRVTAATAGLAAILAVVGLSVFLFVEMSGPPDPILDARDCREIYELLGATEGPEILDLPPLSPAEINDLEERLTLLEDESGSDPACARLREDLEAQR